MRRLVSAWLDEAAFAWFRWLVRDALRDRSAYRPTGACDPGCLSEVAPPRHVSRVPLQPWRGYRLTRFRFPSALPCGQAESDLVCGSLVESGPGRPWVVVVPGFGVGMFPQHGWGLFLWVQARALLEQGMNVALVEPPMHMSRQRRGYRPGAGLFGPDLHLTQQLFLQGAGDIVAIVRWLRSEFGQSVAVWGTSLGGSLAALAAAHCPELSALALLEPLDNPSGPLFGGPSHRTLMLRDVGARTLSPDGIEASLRYVAPSSYRPALPPDRILFVIPQWDRIVPVHLQERLWEAWGRPERWSLQTGHVGAAGSREVAARIAGFLNARLPGLARREPEQAAMSGHTYPRH